MKVFVKTSTPNKRANGAQVSLSSDNAIFRCQFDAFDTTNNHNFDMHLLMSIYLENPSYTQTTWTSQDAGEFRVADRKSANRVAKDLSPILYNALDKLKQDFTQGRQGGYSEKNRKIIQDLNAHIKNLKPNDVIGKT